MDSAIQNISIILGTIFGVITTIKAVSSLILTYRFDKAKQRLPVSEFVLKYGKNYNIEKSQYFRERMFSDFYGKKVNTMEVEFFTNEDLTTEQIETYFNTRPMTELWQSEGNFQLAIKTSEVKIPFIEKPIQVLKYYIFTSSVTIASIISISLSTLLLENLDSMLWILPTSIILAASFIIFFIAYTSFLFRANPIPALQKNLKPFLKKKAREKDSTKEHEVLEL